MPDEYLSKFPQTDLFIEIVRGCNLRCKMCPSTTFPFKENQYLDKEVINDLLEQTPTLDSLNIIGLGEPLLHPELKEILEITRSHDVAVTFTTNGHLLTRELIMSLPPKCWVCFSIDSLQPEVYKKIRGVEIDPVLENMRLFRELKPKDKIWINVVIMKDNVNHLTDFIPFAKELNASIHFLLPLTHKSTDYHKFYPDFETLKTQLKQLYKLAKIAHVEVFLPPIHPRLAHCALPFRGVTVNVEGDTFPCCYVCETPTHFDEWYDKHGLTVPQKQYLLGNVFETDMEELFKGEKIVNVRQTIIDTPKPSTTFNELRRDSDLSNDHEYCNICANRWGVIC